jgi:single-strand DNA-binding protein
MAFRIATKVNKAFAYVSKRKTNGSGERLPPYLSCPGYFRVGIISIIYKNFTTMFSTVDNRVQLIGFLGQEIEVKEYAEGKKVAHVSMATHESRKDEHGNKEKITTWHNLTVWGKKAEVMAKIFSKGQRLYVEGKLSYREYTNKDNQKKQATEIIVSDFKKLERDDKKKTIEVEAEIME